MKNLTKAVWTLWPTIDAMAWDLGESVNALRLARDQGRLPDARHDRIIATKARALNRRITIKGLTEFRENPPVFGIDARRIVIQGFYDAAGGVRAVSERTGVTPNHLYSCKARGTLNLSAKHEHLSLAQEVGFDLPPAIFESPTR